MRLPAPSLLPSAPLALFTSFALLAAGCAEDPTLTRLEDDVVDPAPPLEEPPEDPIENPVEEPEEEDPEDEDPDPEDPEEEDPDPEDPEDEDPEEEDPVEEEPEEEEPEEEEPEEEEPEDEPLPDPCIGQPSGTLAMVGAQGFVDLQAAVDAAAAVDGVASICPGIHVLSTPLMISSGQTVTLAAGNADPTTTALDGGTTSRVVQINGGGDVTLQNLGIQNGWASYEGGGLYVGGAQSLTLDGCVLTGNVADYSGGGMYVGSVDVVTLLDTTFLDNTSWYEGAAIELSAASPSTTLYVEATDFTANYADYEGGVELTANTGRLLDATFHSVSFVDNVADYSAAALDIGGSGDVDVVMNDCELINNQTDYEAGAIIVGGSGARTLTVNDSLFDANRSSYTSGTFLFGGSPSSTVVTLNNTILMGSGSGYEASAIGAWSNGNPLSITAIDSSIYGNLSPGGAAVELTGAATFDSVNVDWGTGALDNGPADVITPSRSLVGLGSAETFTCAAAGPC